MLEAAICYLEAGDIFPGDELGAGDVGAVGDALCIDDQPGHFSGRMPDDHDDCPNDGSRYQHDSRYLEIEETGQSWIDDIHEQIDRASTHE